MLRSLWKKVLLFALLPATVFAANQNMVQTGNGYDIQYPLVYLANEKAQTAINTDIGTYVASAKERLNTKNLVTSNLTYKVAYEDDRYLSIIFKPAWYYQGAAHGMYNEIGVVYDKTTGEKLPRSYFLNVKSPTFLTEHMPIAGKDLPKNPISFFDGSVKNHIELKPPTWSNVPYVSDSYYLGGDGSIYLIYQPYELASYAEGATKLYFYRPLVDYFNGLNKEETTTK